MGYIGTPLAVTNNAHPTGYPLPHCNANIRIRLRTFPTLNDATIRSTNQLSKARLTGSRRLF